jgi:single-strand DNA-binding protein
MPGINKVILIGNLGKDPNLKHTQGGSPVTSFSLATSEKWAKDGQSHEKTTWHNVVIWGKLAEFADQYLQKGSQVYIEGKIDYRMWEDKDGNKRNRTEIIAERLAFLSSKQSNGNNDNHSNERSEQPPPNDDIPF